ncbi:MAG: type 1 glutamine amidotransferase [Actinomycetota bacterium]|nr:glutamine amidotransferase [Actinomycetota bacterium]
MSADLHLVHLYPDLLRTYGDRGNIVALQKRAEWRGFAVEITSVSRGDAVPTDASLILIGGGSDRVQEIIGPDILARGPELANAASHGVVVLGVCGGYQLLGHEYVAADGTAIQGLGLLDVTTGTGRGRIIGRVNARAQIDGRTFDLVGFENHGGRTRLGSGATTLAVVPKGQGNNGVDRTEGAVQGSFFGTYLHGPVLPANPELADALLERALAKRLDGEPLKPLDDSLEEAAHRESRHRRR